MIQSVCSSLPLDHRPLTVFIPTAPPCSPVPPVAINQEIMAREGAVEMLIKLIGSQNDLIQRQSAKALANLGVNSDNKRKIALAGGIPKLVMLAQSPLISIKIEVIAALANLAVNGEH